MHYTREWPLYRPLLRCCRKAPLFSVSVLLVRCVNTQSLDANDHNYKMVASPHTLNVCKSEGWSSLSVNYHESGFHEGKFDPPIILRSEYRVLPLRVHLGHSIIVACAFTPGEGQICLWREHIHWVSFKDQAKSLPGNIKTINPISHTSEIRRVWVRECEV